MFEASFSSAVEKYHALLHAEKAGQLKLPNTNFDVGDESYPGKYRLNDDAHAELLHQLAGNKFNGITPQLRSAAQLLQPS